MRLAEDEIGRICSCLYTTKEYRLSTMMEASFPVGKVQVQDSRKLSNRYVRLEGRLTLILHLKLSKVNFNLTTGQGLA